MRADSRDGGRTPGPVRGAQGPEGIAGKLHCPVPQGPLVLPEKHAIVTMIVKVLGENF